MYIFWSEDLGNRRAITRKSWHQAPYCKYWHGCSFGTINIHHMKPKALTFTITLMELLVWFVIFHLSDMDFPLCLLVSVWYERIVGRTRTSNCIIIHYKWILFSVRPIAFQTALWNWRLHLNFVCGFASNHHRCVWLSRTGVTRVKSMRLGK